MDSHMPRSSHPRNLEQPRNFERSYVSRVPTSLWHRDQPSVYGRHTQDAGQVLVRARRKIHGYEPNTVVCEQGTENIICRKRMTRMSSVLILGVEF
jgi:hypothetical protein